MREMFLMVCVFVVCMVKMLIEMYQEGAFNKPCVEKCVVHSAESSLDYLKYIPEDLQASVRNVAYVVEEPEETLEDMRLRFKDRYTKNMLSRPMETKHNNLFSLG